MFIKCNICANRCYKKPTRQHFGRIGFVAITIIDKISDKTILTPLLYYPRSCSGWHRCHAVDCKCIPGLCPRSCSGWHRCHASKKTPTAVLQSMFLVCCSVFLCLHKYFIAGITATVTPERRLLVPSQFVATRRTGETKVTYALFFE